MAEDYIVSFIQIMNKLKRLHCKYPVKDKLNQSEYIMLGMLYSLLEEKRNSGKVELWVKAGELTKRLHLSKSATSKMLGILEEKKYLERMTDKKDRRNVFIKLTLLGNKVVRESEQAIHDFTKAVISELGSHDAHDLIRILNKLYDILEVKVKKVAEEQQGK